MSTNSDSGAMATVSGATVSVGDRTSAVPSPISDVEASRFLAQASMGATRDEIARVRQLGYGGWLDEQLAMPRTQSRWDWMVSQGYSAPEYKNAEQCFDFASWRKLIASPDTLRQRVALALSEILVVGIDGIGGGWKNFAAAHYQDILEANAFGNYRRLLEDVSLSPAMGTWLTYRGSTKAKTQTGALPDENYAREIMQLFTIGLVQLNGDGTPLEANGAEQYTYTQDDIMGLARVWTGWNWDMAGIVPTGAAMATPDLQGRPMIQNPGEHETGKTTFLGVVVPEGTDGLAGMAIALDTLFNHPNVGPFIGKQLIQRLVTSNPTPGYVARVAAAFNDDGTGVRGDLKAVVRAVLLDDEARNPANVLNPIFGKLREPILRFTNWARAYGANSPSGAWKIGNLSDPAKALGQSPLRSQTVFNFFRPGYAPPNIASRKANLLAPEFQITNEVSVVGYVNFMERAVGTGINDVVANYDQLIPLATDAHALLSEINTVLAAGQISPPTLDIMVGAVGDMADRTTSALKGRVYTALLMVLASPEYIVQK